MTEEEEIALARKYGPRAIRGLAETARETEGASERHEAIVELVGRGFLPTLTPDDDELARIEAMSDEEIDAVLWRAMH